MADGSAAPPLLVFADDWGRHPSSCQHLVSRLLSRYRVWWVNTIGMRPPRIDRATLSRGLEKLRHWKHGLTGPRAGYEEYESKASPERVLNPRMWPWMRSRLDRWLNRRLLTKALADLVAKSPSPPIALTTIPIVADLMGVLPVRRWIYYCVDDFTEWPGLDGDALRVMENRLVAQADALISVGETLQAKLNRLGRSSQLLTHGVDLEMWHSDSAPALPRGYATMLEPPLVVFWGVVDRRMDTELVRRLATDMTAGTIVLVGPQADPDPEILRLPRVTYRPPLAHAALPRLARRAEVLVMPYADLPVTRAMQPLKLKEYLATGKPVVVRDLPANRAWADALDIGSSAEEFSAKVRQRLRTGTPTEQQQARKRLVHESWDTKAAEFENLVLGCSAREPADEVSIA